MNLASKLSVAIVASSVLGCSGVGGYQPAKYDGGSSEQSSVKVQPTFPYAIWWNSYVVNDGTKSWNGSGIGCSTTLKTDAVECLHAGEQRKFTLPNNVTSCSGLSAEDALGVFDWTCDATGGTVTFYSTGLKTGKGLRDLVDGGAIAWRPNSLIVTGSYQVQSATSVWWTNAVLALPNNSGATDAVVNLDSAGAVYVESVSGNSRGYNIGADQISLVTLGTATLSYVGTATNNCNGTNGSTTSPDMATLVCGGDHKFVWLEVALATTAALDANVFLVKAHFLRGLNTTSTGSGFGLGSTNGARLTNVRLSYGGLNLFDSNGLVVSQVQTSRSGIRLVGSNNSTLSDLLVGNGYQGIVLQGSTNNVITRASILGTEDTGLEISGGSSVSNIFSWMTILNTGSFAVANYSGTNSIFHGIVSANSTTHGWNIGTTSSISHAAVLHGQYNGIALNSSNNKFSGNLLAGSNPSGDCNVFGSPTAPGLNGTCQGTDLSTGLLTYTGGLSAANSFKGKITVDDVANADDTNGAVGTYPAAPATFDWIHFLKTSLGPFELFRAWGADGSVFPNADHRSSWEHLGGGGRIWDLALASTDTVLRNTTGDGATQNAPLVVNAACPPWLAGSRTITDASNSITYLANAYEIMGDGVGNDDGLCESNERCVAAPNFGAYQGDGDWSANRCAFTNGTVTGVTMYFSPTNGR